MLAYNLKRVIRILGFTKALRAMKLAGARTRVPTLLTHIAQQCRRLRAPILRNRALFSAY